MNEKVLETIEKDRKEKRQIPVEIRKEIDKKVFENILIAIVVMLYFIFIELGYLNIKKDIFIIDLKVFSISLVTIAIVLFEKAYKKDSGKIAINGIEVLVLALITMALPYTFFYLNPFYKWLGTMFGLIYAIYYTLKSIFIYQKMKKAYINSLSDIKEIVKKEKRKKKELEDIEEVQEVKEEKKKEELETTVIEPKVTQTKRKRTTKSSAKTEKKESKEIDKEVKTKKTSKKTKNNSEESKSKNTKTKKTTKKTTNTNEETQPVKPKKKKKEVGDVKE